MGSTIRSYPISSVLVGAILAACHLTGCAGPSTPLGAVWSFNEPQPPLKIEDESVPKKKEIAPEKGANRKLAFTGAAYRPKISFSPSKQVLHGPARVRVEIEDLMGDLDQYDLQFRYNGFDVSSSFLARSKIHKDRIQRKIVVENIGLRLPSYQDHRIEVIYVSSSGAMATAKYYPPVCNAFDFKKVLHAGDFEASAELLKTIQQAAYERGFSPAFLTALIAQESGFNPKVVSYAKALGLTQVTSLAEQELIPHYSNWPRHPAIPKLSARRLRMMVRSGKINAKNEWRLDTERSIKGGALFLKILMERWSTRENEERIRGISKSPQLEKSRLVLASYHSGYARVSAALAKLGKNWDESRHLREARKYVNRIFSYCTYFSENQENYL